jgi:uncharacterized protein (TIGR03437 family)
MGVQMNITADLVDTMLAGVRVLFDGHPAPLLFVQADQINAIVPFDVAGQSSTGLQLEYNGKQSASIDIPLADSAPALFAADASGQGQGAVLNQDYSANSSNNPAPTGSVVMLYATGGGLLDRSISAAAITGSDLAQLALPRSVQIDGIEGEVLYAGSAPGLVAAVIQVNVRIPQGVRAGNVSVVLKVGAFSSQPDLTIAVR